VRILQVVHDFLPESLAGTEVNTHKLAVDLRARHGHEVHVFCRGWNLECEPYRERTETLDGLRVQRVDFGRGGARNSWRRHDDRLEDAFRRTLDRVRPDLVHFQHFIYLSTELVAIAKAYAPVVVTLRNFWFRCPRGTLLYHDETLCHRAPGLTCLSCLWPDQQGRRRKVIPWRQLNPLLIAAYQRLDGRVPLPPSAGDILRSIDTWADEFRAALLLADRLHAPSAFLKEQLVSFGIPATNVAMIPNGVAYDPARPVAKQPGDRLRLGMIGAHRLKGLHLLLDAFCRLPDGVAEVQVYGQSADHRYLEEQQRRVAGRPVRFCGTYRQDQLAEVFRTIDVVVVPSLWYENCPTVIREAFAMRTPVVAADIGGMAEAVRDGVDGLLFSAGSADSLHRALAWLIAHPDAIERMSHQITPPLTQEQCTDAIVEVYDDVVTARTAPGRQTAVATSVEEPVQVSVIVPAYNEARVVRLCVESLLQQAGCTFEILAVDDGSTDATAMILTALARRDGRVRLLRQEHRGAAAARNRGAQVARGTILAFGDADMVFAPSYLAALTAPIVRGEAVGTFSKEEYVANWESLWARCWNLNEGLTTNRRHPADFPERHTVFRAVRRDAFERVQGFTPAGAGDDTTLAAKIGALAQAAPGAVCYHHNPSTLGEVFRSSRWYGRGMREPATWRNILTHTPPVSIKRSLRRAIGQRAPAFLAFKLVADSGILVGLIEKRFGVRRPGR
jgi:glycosyltransferase involved in cell wall biosynthesis/GT2 family glycosyltransferase